MKRRHFLAAGLAVPALLADARSQAHAAAGQSVPTASGHRRRTLRFVHLTDVHVDEKKPRSPAGFARALQTIEGLEDRPAFILNGGDAIFDGFARDREDTAGQWRLWHDIVGANTALPWLHCLGNHDIWGWRWRDDPRIAGDAHYGKAWALDEHGIERRYHASTHGGWRIIVLDSTQLHPSGYTGLVDPEQREWLEAELVATPADTPILIASHIPIVSFAARIWFGGTPSEAQREVIERALVHTDAVALKDLFARHPNVRACLSGHLHMQESIDYLGVTYACSGAVSGNWWNEDNPAFQEFGPAIAIVDCYDDGTVEHAMVPVP